ncbi:n-alpha-acetyltransferase 50 isoform x2 [Vairimorpha ceranae]|nr:n-alpha-acetyltransferase 50 isoform x2 [Vairimorpha ceranae]KKO75775.1 n-alpha-acetyltransferase 50 isoform x2 [Vairimorpha ceranae]
MFRIKLEKITVQNIDLVKKMNESLFPIEYSHTFYKYILDTTCTKGFFFIFRDCKIGVCTFSIRGTLHNKSINECYIMTFGILDKYRNLGFGSKCIALLENYAVENYNVKSFKLHVHTSNFKGINFYKKNFYKITELEMNYYKNIEPCSAYLFVKIL